MEIRIDDIPINGKDLLFSLDTEDLNSRVSGVVPQASQAKISVPSYVFTGEAKADLHLSLHGETISLKGCARGTFTTLCARCGEEVGETLEIPIDIFLKPRTSDSLSALEDEDVGLGYYDGEKVNCGEVVEEQLILSLPMVVRCKSDTACGSLGSKEWVFGEEEVEQVGDERLSVLKTIKIH